MKFLWIFPDNAEVETEETGDGQMVQGNRTCDSRFLTEILGGIQDHKTIIRHANQLALPGN